jgi:predicted protein tyrosine phosphatase
MSEYEAKRKSSYFSVPTAIISITEPTEEPVIFADNSNIKEIFRMRFYDLEVGKNELKEATQEDFNGLKTFIDSLKAKNIEQLIVHCAAGISRSAGVACAIDEYLGLNNNFWFQRQYFPNIHVYKLTCNELGISKTQETYNELFGVREENSMYSG